MKRCSCPSAASTNGSIKGDDSANPVVLFPHGGPGNALSPFADAMFAGWEKDLTLVQWDQRGAGRTYTKNGMAIEPTMTLERMTQDTGSR